MERLEESRRSKRRSSLTVRVPRNRPQENSKPAPVARKTKRYRPSPHNRGERKHNILSNISICGGDDEENNKKTETEEEAMKDVEIPTSIPNQNVIIEPVNQLGIGEDELTGLLLASNGWDECQMELLDSLLDSL